MEPLERTTEETVERVADIAVKVEQKIEEKLTVLWNEVDTWQQDNHYIVSGYRPASNSYRKSAGSLFYLHNESVNIWTHLLGSLAAIIGSVVLYGELKERYHSATQDDVLVFACFFAGAAACLGMSATYHAISNHSHGVAKFGNKLDYLGIVFLIWGSFVASIYYGFQEDVMLMRRYWAMITTIGAGCAVVSTDSRFRTPQLRPLRAGMFVAMGLSAVVPVFHGLQLYGVEKMTQLIGLPWLLVQGLLYLIGAGLYAARVPERFHPGRYDIWGSSHQIFHVLVVLAAAAHLVGLIKAFDHRHSRPDLPPRQDVFQLSWN